MLVQTNVDTWVQEQQKLHNIFRLGKSYCPMEPAMVSRPNHLLLSRQFLDAMIEHARTELPNECCGLLAGVRDGAVLRVEARHELVNETPSPKEYFAVKSVFAATKKMREFDHEIVAIYHSHPTSEPIPSNKDLKRNFHGDTVVHFIIGFYRLFYLFPLGAKAYVPESTPRVRGWWLTETTFADAAWEIVEP
jgi:proteasome lid subunit RPN8/RPN11